MKPLSPNVFDLPDRLAHKRAPALVEDDERFFAAVRSSLDQAVADLQSQLAGLRTAPVRAGQEVLERDLQVHRISGRLRLLGRFGLDLCLGRMDPADGSAPVHIGRLGLKDAGGDPLLVDWRSPAAEPFFGATHADPMGLASRRRYRWTGGRVSDYWDEVFAPEDFAGHAGALDDQSAFIASLGSSRSPRMRDVLGTIQADQDAVIRAGSHGALVVDGGPGTGKTVVALHRAAYLLYSDPRLEHHRGGVLVVGPSQPYLAYVGDVLPSLGEDGVRTCTVSDLLPEGATAAEETDPEVARLKASAELVRGVERAVRFYEEPPTDPLTVSSDWADVTLDADDWAEAFASPAPGTPHNEAREQVWDELLTILAAKHDGSVTEDVPEDVLRRSLARDSDLRDALHRAWPLVGAEDLVGDLWSVPAYLRLAAPWLDRDAVRRLQRREPQLWTRSDLPFLDAARHRLGDPQAAARARRRTAALAAQRDEMAKVIEHLIATDDSEMHLMSMLRGDDLLGALDDQDALDRADPDALAGPFAHIVVDEAQELTDAEWQMLLVRCPSRSFTVVGDRAQARHGFTESWAERLGRVGLERVELASLSVNYRTPREVMAQAEPVIRAVLPDANVPVSIREGGLPVVHGHRSELSAVVDRWLAEHDDGVACVIGDPEVVDRPRLRSLTPALAKGLEFDLVVLVDPEDFGVGVEGAVDRYVAMTRATQQLVILTTTRIEVKPRGGRHSPNPD